jgi:ABC-type nitrate/sulfonate/bicarbonate transport system substrate-binding protein
LQKKYDLLKDLYKDSLKEDAKKWWKKTEKEIFSKKESLKQKAERLKAEYEKVRQMWDWVQNQVKLAEIEDEYRKIIAEWNETNNFEAEVSSLSWWKEDQSPESTPTLEDMSKIV